MIFSAWALCLVMIVGVASEPPALSKLTRWSAAEPSVGRVDGIGAQGVGIKVGEAIIPVVVPWYDVRGLSPATAEYKAYEQIADDAWRAHARLMRGDYFGAEALYTKLEGQYLWRVGLQSADVSIGLVRCRLDRQHRVGAVEPLVSWLGASGGGFGSRLVSGFDADFGLFIELPPVFGPRERGQSVGSIPDGDRITERQRAIFGYYQLALDTSAHRTPEALELLEKLSAMTRGREGRDPGIRLFEEMVIAQVHQDAQKRLAARVALKRRIRTDPDTWIELWARLAIGVSLLGEADTESNERGVIELIHVIVRFDHISHSLVVLASQIANEYLVRTDRSPWGAELMRWARRAGLGGQSEILLFQSFSKEHSAHE